MDKPAGLNGLSADVCVVGSGPVGTCLALDLAERGLSVVVLESGLAQPDKAAQACADAHLATPQHHAPMSLAVYRGLGGTSRLWGGRCLPLDSIDFASRDYIPSSGWPIGVADIAEFHDRACAMLGCGPDRLTDPTTAAGAVKSRTLWREIERWTNRPSIYRQLAGRLAACPRLTVVLGATVVDLELRAGSDAVQGLTIANGSERIAFSQAKYYVLAMGGVETARLLLNVQMRLPALFGGVEGVLGRYYMGHLSGQIADIKFRDPALVSAFNYRRCEGFYIRHRFTLDAALQAADRLPNIAFYPINPRLADAEHRSGILSAIYLALAAPSIGKRLISEAIRQSQIAGPQHYAAHVRNIFLDLPATVGALTGILHQVLADRRKPLFFLPNKAGIHPLHFHAEQRPDRNSRVSLAPDRDAYGLRRASIDLRFSDEDGEGVVRAHESLQRLLSEQRIGDLVYQLLPEGRVAAVVANAKDGFHQIGTTRMAAGPRDGVVDRDCRVFDFGNLYIAGSSVFPTSGQANPTFPAVALALRLAAHLDHSLHAQAPTIQ